MVKGKRQKVKGKRTRRSKCLERQLHFPLDTIIFLSDGLVGMIRNDQVPLRQARSGY